MSASESCPLFVDIRKEDFDIGLEISRLTNERSNIGAVVSFTGLCRDENGKLSALELEHYPGMAKSQITQIAKSAMQRWSLSGVTVIHRYGLIRPGENIVLVVTSSTHRVAAFDAASFLMDFLKTNAPFWKREHLTNQEQGGWVEAREEDQLRLDRWRQP